MKNKNNKRIIALLSIALLLFTGYRIYHKSNIINLNNSNDTSVSVDKVESDLKIKYLKTSTNSQGQEVISFNYEVLPVEANDKTVTISLLWSDTSITDDINEYLSYTHDETDFYVEISCLQKSNHQAKFTLVSNANNNATASVLIDFEQEFLGFSNNEINLSKTLALSSDEILYNEKDIKTKILSLSNGFLGTISINDKVISDFNMTLGNVAISLNNPLTEDYISNDTELNNIYIKARENSLSTDFINTISEDYIRNLSNSQKEAIRTSDTIELNATYNIAFNYYGESFEFTCNLVDTVSAEAFANSTYVNVDSITVEGNIIFK